MTNNKILKIATAIILMISLSIALAGCDFGIAKKNKTIHWYMPKSIDNMSDQALVEKTVNEILNKEIGISLKFHLIEKGNYTEKMNVIISSADEYDICFTSSWANDFTFNANKNAFIDHTELLQKYGQNILAKTDKRALEAVKINGKIMAVPSQGAYATPIGFVFKKDLIDKYGFDYSNVRSRADLIPYLEKIKQNEPDVTPLLNNIPPNDSYPYTDANISGLLFNEETGKFENIYLIPSIIEQYRGNNNFYQKGYFAKDVLTKTDIYAEAKSEKYAVMGNTGVYSADGSKSSSAYGFPCVESFAYYTTITTGTIFGALNAISTTSKQSIESMKLMNLIWKDTDLSNTIAYGVEGINYTVSPSSTPEKKTVIPTSGKAQTWALWNNMIGPLFDQWDSSWNSQEALAAMKKNNETAISSKILGFTLDTANVKTEFAQIASIAKEVSPVFSTGSMPDFDSYLEKTQRRLSDAGIEKLKEEAQKQVDAWLHNR